MPAGVIICSRLSSSRVPGKAARKIMGIPVIRRLVNNMPDCIPTIVSVPLAEKSYYDSILVNSKAEVHGDIINYHNPMGRMYKTALKYGLTEIVRICHDKIFVDSAEIMQALANFKTRGLDYLYLSPQTEGTGFEIISIKALEKACNKFGAVEHISYAIREVLEPGKIGKMSFDSYEDRLMIDYPEDFESIRNLIENLRGDSTKKAAIDYLRNNSKDLPYRLPRLTVYTCAKNADRHLNECLKSVRNQNFDFEYLLINDGSTDRTAEIMQNFCNTTKFARYIENKENIGLAASSNLAISQAKGEYVLRLDADDYLANNDNLSELCSYINYLEADIVYPCYFDGSFEKVVNGNKNHHMGGAIAKRSSLNYIKFTEKLRGYEGLDWITRARHRLKVDYYHYPTFFYRHTEGSLSRTNLKEREKIKQEILNSNESQQ